MGIIIFLIAMVGAGAWGVGYDTAKRDGERLDSLQEQIYLEQWNRVVSDCRNTYNICKRHGGERCWDTLERCEIDQYAKWCLLSKNSKCSKEL